MSEGATHLIRPDQPDPALLNRAAARVAQLNGMSEPDWIVSSRLERPRSTIFVLESTSDRDEPVRAFYKVDLTGGAHFNDRRTLQWRAAKSASLALEERLSDLLADALERIGVRHDRLLATDPDLLAAVRLHVPGTPLGKRLERPFAPADLAVRIGRTIRTCEDVGRSEPTDLTIDDIRSAFDRYVNRVARQKDRALVDRIEGKCAELVDQLDPATCTSWTHGDMSSTNLLVDGSHLGVIDFSWQPKLVGNDLHHLLTRTSISGLLGPVSAGSVEAALISGYGPMDDAHRAAFDLAGLQRAVRLISKPGLRRRRRGIAVIRSVLGP